MRVAELTEPHRFRLVEQPRPEPGPGEVLVRVRSVGVCGSDLHNFTEGSVGDIPSVFPMVLGHEPAGEVVRCGTGVTGLSAGDKVLLEPAIYCYHCEYCLSGHHNVCARLRFMSQPGDPGFFRDYVTLPAANAVGLPEGLDLREGTLFEPLAVALHSMKFVDLRPGETVAVFGAGPIGLLTIGALSLAGASRIWAIEPVAPRREMALQAGATAVIDPRQVDPVQEILAETGRRGVDVAVDCAAKENTMNQCLRVTRYAGRVVITGIPSEVLVALEFHVMRRKEIALYNVRRSNHETGTALELLRTHPGKFVPMLTHHRPIEGIECAFKLLERYEDGVGKLTIEL